MNHFFTASVRSAVRLYTRPRGGGGGGSGGASGARGEGRGGRGLPTAERNGAIRADDKVQLKTVEQPVAAR